jgi:hypothetical protein
MKTICQKEMIDLIEIKRKMKFNIYLSQSEENILRKYHIKEIRDIDFLIKSKYRDINTNAKKPIKIIIRTFNTRDKFIFIRNTSDICFLLKILSRKSKPYIFNSERNEIVIEEL